VVDLVRIWMNLGVIVWAATVVVSVVICLIGILLLERYNMRGLTLPTSGVHEWRWVM